MLDRGVRSLHYLQDSASTARVLNLAAIARRRRGLPAWSERPMFQNERLNRCLIVKHRLRREEIRLLSGRRGIATKIVLPFDGADLKLGGRVIFVGEGDYAAQMRDALGEAWTPSNPDAEMLGLLDAIPTLDPFLLREQLRRHDREPARCYFEISDGDMEQMRLFVEEEVRQLVLLCYAQSSAADDGAAARLVSKILSNTVDADTEPLRLTLRLERRDYEEGVFCWKGFLYYKWLLHQTLSKVGGVAAAFGRVKPKGAISPEGFAYFEAARRCLRAGIVFALEDVKRGVSVYDEAFDSLGAGEAGAFRDFLLKAPTLFWKLGEQLGALEHIISFWNYRFPHNTRPTATAGELADIFSEFAHSLGLPETPAQAASMPGVGVMPERPDAFARTA
jgi:hypothetical protein